MLHLPLFTKRNIHQQRSGRKFLLFLALSMMGYIQVQAQETIIADTVLPDKKVFELGEVIVTKERLRPINATLDAEKIQNFYKTDVARALNMLPGVNLSAVGPRNEAMVYVRGFDLKQVPVLIDGIPVYVPYDGYADLARFTTFDLSEVNVSKGYTSVIYGPNSLGGAINLISRKPSQKLELYGASGWMTRGYRTNVNVGSNMGKFYVQAGASRLKKNYYSLSKSFAPIKNEDGGNRENSYSDDEKFNIKVGYAPKGRSEYALSYIYQHGRKGTPVYVGSDVLNSMYKSPRYWQWPAWDKQSLYFISNTNIDSSSYIKTRIYYDVFRNILNSYDNASYTTISKPYAFQSYYNDYTVGGITEYGKKLWKGKDLFKATLQYKQDVHRENNANEPVRTLSDRTVTAGLENELKLHSRLLLLTGFSYNFRGSIQAMNYNSTNKSISDFPKNNNSAYNVQCGLVYSLNDRNTFNFSVARKTRFATVKDRYSYRLGTAIPNPDLKSEYTLNYELGYKGSPARQMSLQAALFYSHISNTIMNVNNVQYDTDKKTWQSQLQNVGQSEFMGGEIGAEYSLLVPLKLGANYTYIERNNLSGSSYFTDVPNHKLFGFLQYQYLDKFYVQVNGEYNSRRYSTSYGTSTAGFGLLNARASAKIWKYFSVEVGINNLLDKNYALVEGYPEMGRNYFTNLIYKY